MKYSMYVLRDTVADVSDGVFLYRNDNHAITEIAHRLNDSQRERMELVCIGEYDNESHIILNSFNRVVGFIPKPNINSPKGVQTPLDSGSVAFQEQKFLEKTSDIG